MNEALDKQLEWECQHLGNVTKEDWGKLRSAQYFPANWDNPDVSRMWAIIGICMWRGFNEKKTMSVIKIWHKKHGHTFDAIQFWKAYVEVGIGKKGEMGNEEKILLRDALKYWEAVRRIQFDPKARSHSKMRVSYFLANIKQSTAKDISDTLKMPIKTVRNALAVLLKSRRIRQPLNGIYETLESKTWDEGFDTVYDVPPDYLFMGTPNQRTDTKMRCWDYMNDRSITVNVQGYPSELEWVIDHTGTVVHNGALVGKWDSVQQAQDAFGEDIFSRLRYLCSDEGQNTPAY